MIGRTACRGRFGALEAQLRQIQLVDEGVDGAYRVVLGDPVVQSLWQQRGLGSALTFDEPLHRAPLRVAR